MSKMLYRNEERNLKLQARKYPVVVVYGPRGNSKTHLVRSAFPTKDYIDLSKDNILGLAKKSLKTFLLAFPQGAIINEADRISGMVEAVKYYVDKWGYEPGRYILTSSTELAIESLQDRGTAVCVLSPSVEDLDKSALLSENPFQIIQKGQFPKVMDGSKTYGEILGRCFTKDFSKHINSTNRETFLNFLSVCATYSAKALSMNAIARQSGISAPTVKQWIGLLRTYNIMTVLQNRDGNTQSLLFNDSGLLCHLLGIDTKEHLILSPYRDEVVRSFALSELLKGCFSKSLEPQIEHGDGSDFRATWKLPYEIFVDPSIEVTEDVLKKAQNRADGIGNQKVVVLYLGDVTYSQGKVDCIGYRDWNKFASGVDYFS